MNAFQFFLALLDRLEGYVSGVYHEFQDLFWILGIVVALLVIRLLQA